MHIAITSDVKQEVQAIGATKTPKLEKCGTTCVNSNVMSLCVLVLRVAARDRKWHDKWKHAKSSTGEQKKNKAVYHA